LARTHPAVSPRSARCFNAARSESNRAWCEGGDTPWYQEAASPSAPCRCRGEAGVGVAEVEPPPLPLRVVGGHRARDVLLPVRASQRKRQPAGARRAASPRLRRGQRVQFCAEEVDLEIPVYRDPQEAFTDADEHGGL
jgi:hypothetical protein